MHKYVSLIDSLANPCCPEERAVFLIIRLWRLIKWFGVRNPRQGIIPTWTRWAVFSLFLFRFFVALKEKKDQRKQWKREKEKREESLCLLIASGSQGWMDGEKGEEGRGKPGMASSWAGTVGNQGMRERERKRKEWRKLPLNCKTSFFFSSSSPFQLKMSNQMIALQRREFLASKPNTSEPLLVI